MTGCAIDGGRFRIYTDWLAHGDDFVRMVVRPAAERSARLPRKSAAGRVVQRLVELDKCVRLGFRVRIRV